MKTQKIFLLTVFAVLIFSALTGFNRGEYKPPLGDTAYDPPVAFTTYYHLRMWGEGDRPGADSINKNLIDIDLYLHNISVAWLDSINAHKIRLNNLTDSITAHRTVLNSLLSGLASLNLELNNIASFVSALEDTAAAHNTLINSLLSGVSSLNLQVNGIATTVSNLEDTAAAHNTSINSLNSNVDAIFGQLNAQKDTMNNNIPRLSINNAFTGTSNSFMNLELKDPGSGPLLKFNPQGGHYSYIKNVDDTVLVMNGTTLSSSASWIFNGTVSLNGTINEGGTSGHLVSAFGSTQEVLFYVASEPGGSATTQLRAVPVTINGVTYYLLYGTPE